MKTDLDFPGAAWERSSYSNGSGGQCVEFARNVPGVVPVRDSKDVARVIAVAPVAWRAFVAQLKG